MAKVREVLVSQVVDDDDPAEMRRWAAGISRGVSLQEMADALGVEPTRRAVYAELTRGVTKSASRRDVREACKHELDKTEGRDN